MAEETAKLVVDAVWQDGTPFNGYLEVTLQVFDTTGSSFVVPKRQQEVSFADGRAEICLVPSSALDGAKYRVRIMAPPTDGNYESKTALLDEMIEMPGADCTLFELLELVVQNAASGTEELELEQGQPGSFADFFV